MKYIESMSNDPYYNLALEEYVLTNFKEDDYVILWQNHNTIVVGKFQNTVEEISSDTVKKYGVSVVRRNTGGGAVYHDLGNLNFSFITDWDKNGSQGYETFLEPVIKGLKSMGINAQNSGRNDLIVDGCKISGNAQTILGGRILHHGTLLINSDLGMLSKVLTPNPAKIQSKGIKSVQSRVTNLSEVLGVAVSTEQVKDALKASFFSKDKVVGRTLSEQELEKVENLAEKKYRTHDWNYSLSPEFNFKKTEYFEGGLVSVELFIKKGVIKSCRIFGDFLALADVEDVYKSLEGVPYIEDDVLKKLEGFPKDIYFGGITANDILKCFF